jgi:hypothetical protein
MTYNNDLVLVEILKTAQQAANVLMPDGCVQIHASQQFAAHVTRTLMLPILFCVEQGC